MRGLRPSCSRSLSRESFLALQQIFLLISEELLVVDDDLAAKLVAQGWQPETVQAVREAGLKYSPARNLFTTGWDIDFD